MPSARLRLKTIKDATVAPQQGTGPEPRMRVLDMAMLPFTLYVRIDVTHVADAAPLFLHLLGRPAPQSGQHTMFVAARVPDAAAAEAPGTARRILLLLTGDEIPEGRYRLALVRDRQHIAFADLIKQADQVRVLTRTAPTATPPITPLLISGTHKSGTTWLETVIDAHPDMMVLHEANTFNVFDVVELRRMVAARQPHFQHRNYIRWLNPAFDVDDFSRFLQISLARELTLRLGRAWGASFVADRTPGYTGLYAHLPRFWEELRVVHIVRHPLDVLTSRLFHEANLQRNSGRRADANGALLQRINDRLDRPDPLRPGELADTADLAGDVLTGLLRGWRRDQDHYLAASRADSAALHLVRYEALLADFGAEAKRLFAFIGADPARTDLPAIARRTSFQALSGGRQPGEADPRSFFRKGVAGDWRTVFSPAQAEALWPVVAPTAASLGYALA